MLRIRLARGGCKQAPFYHIVVANKKNARDGRFIERLGYFNPIAKHSNIKLNINTKRTEYWLKIGACPSKRVFKLIKIYNKDINTMILKI
ncbi:30S ribosomal protein S16 [Candidatus Blochmannia ocreatus (nom. nud.)]|uniref:Small ribosomal subunit protein bS16 n=1 Tax=Candidatus Blochmannia ocreatus (nom. nud.) TaxID=251538 RepID=A0ABY4SV05_9ENTR|nr:30S ribosomal protein S16 [Candidatus Blochmannia ocreatus]URJ25254.1 30S ribosomal protein S16 [Candidatus Blochmannia ocreatus]